MILHIAPDEKFVPFLQSLFEEASPGENLWRLITDKPYPVFASQANNVELINGEYYGSERFKNDLDAANCVIFHSLSLSRRQKLLVLSRIPENMPFVWRGWGFDYYEILQAKGLRMLLPKTKSLTEEIEVSECAHIKQFPRKIVNLILSRTVDRIINNRLIERIDYFSCCVPDDFNLLQRVLPNFRAQFLPLNYYSTEDVLLRGSSLQPLGGNDILLGNSATPSNNHIEAMEVLGKLGMHGRKVIVPLSYGDKKYQRMIIKLGEQFLGGSFVPLTNYMSLSEYNDSISSCGIIIMNHIRQQAIGNISSALLRGGKVFLRRENPIFEYYTRLGVKLFTYSDHITIAELSKPLSQHDAHKNKEIMLRTWPRSQGIKHAKAISLLGKSN